MRKSLLLSLALVLASAVLAPALAFAEDEEEDSGPVYTRSGPFIGAGLAISKELFIGPSTSIDPGIGYSVHFGYRVNEFVAMDVVVRHAFDGNAQLITAMPGIRLYPLGFYDWRIQPALLVNAGYMKADIPKNSLDEKEFAARVGVGLEAYATENIVLGIDITYIDAAGDVRSFNHMGFDFGVTYRF